MNRNKCLLPAWEQYEAGKAYKRKIGLYEHIRQNERFYRGDQWRGAEGDLPRPVFNVIRRVTDFLIGSVARAEYQISYRCEAAGENGARLESALRVLSAEALTKWENNRMDRKIYEVLYNAAISGDGVFYCYWDAAKKTGMPFLGDIVTDVVDGANLFVADVNRTDIQTQEYVMLSGRASVRSLRAEAMKHGRTKEEAMLIVSDGEWENGAGDLSGTELAGEDNEKATYLLYFYKKDGVVHFEKSVRDLVIRRGSTGMSLYPVAYFNWYPTKDSFHGTSPITGLIPNQRYINRAYAMVMKHMQDTAFSKVIYDKSKIPEWSNEVGEAIAAVGGGNIADAVSVVGVGQMQDGFTELIAQAIRDTKEMMGATDTALGDVDARNTSAILALQESAQLPLRRVRMALLQCMEDLGDIWADMMLVHYPAERFLWEGEDGMMVADLRDAVLSARVEAREINRYSSAATQSVLDRLLEGGYITPSEYLERMPEGAILQRRSLLESLKKREKKEECDELANENILP